MAHSSDSTRSEPAARAAQPAWPVKLAGGLVLIAAVLALIYGLGWGRHRPASLDDAARAPSETIIPDQSGSGSSKPAP